MEYYSPKLPCDAAQISRFRKVLGEAGVEQLLKTTIETAVALQAVKKTEFERVIVDTTVQEKAVAHPTDARLLDVARRLIVRHSKRAGIALKMTYEREGKTLRRRAGGYAHAKQFKRLKTVIKRQRTILGVLVREVTRKLEQMGNLNRRREGQTEHRTGAGRAHPHPEDQGQEQAVRDARPGGGVNRQGQGAQAL